MRRKVLAVSSLVSALLFAAMTAAPARADDVVRFDKLTYLTFSGAVRVPGATLQAGTYRFRIVDVNTTRRAMQVLSRDAKTVYAMFPTWVAYAMRQNITKETTVTFYETPPGVPPAIKAMFYGYEHFGYEFQYKKGELDSFNQVMPQPPITYARIPEATVAEAAAPAAVPEPEPVVSEPAAEPAAPVKELPKTASPFFEVALGGLASVLLGFGTGFIGRRRS